MFALSFKATEQQTDATTHDYTGTPKQMTVCFKKYNDFVMPSKLQKMTS